MKFFLHHYLSWPFLAANSADAKATEGNRLSHKEYDPQKGSRLFSEYLSTLTLAEEWGFDGVSLSEHHQTPYSLSPAPRMLAACLSQRTKRMQIAILGMQIHLNRSPLHLAEELALLDQLLQGRWMVGYSLGQASDYYTMQSNPAFAWEQFKECFQLIRSLWSTEVVSPWNGKNQFYRHLNVWPLPSRDNQPARWLEALPIQPVLDFIVQEQVGLHLPPYCSFAACEHLTQRFRETCAKAGFQPDASQIGWTIPIYVSKTDEQARTEFEPHLHYFLNHLLQHVTAMPWPPGMFASHTQLSFLRHQRHVMHNQLGWSELVNDGYIIAGSPGTVRNRINHYRKELGAGVLFGIMQLGSLPHMLTRKSMALMAREVLPFIRNDTLLQPASMDTPFPVQSHFDTATIES